MDEFKSDYQIYNSKDQKAIRAKNKEAENAQVMASISKDMLDSATKI